MAKVLADDVVVRYRKIMMNEVRIRPEHSFEQCFCRGKCVFDLGNEFFCMATRLFEIAKLSTVSRSYNLSYNLYADDFIYESVAAHTNLLSAIATMALDFRYGYGFGTSINRDWPMTVDDYSYREIMETIAIHDLAENDTGDLPDNGTRNEEEKNQQELRFVREYLNMLPSEDEDLRIKILKLFQEMQERNSSTGKLIFLSDKMAALIVTLCLDLLGHSPLMPKNSLYASERDQAEMRRCDSMVKGQSGCPGTYAFKASEMWAIDFFQMRHLVKHDESFFFTALLVMATLIVNKSWYSWRKDDYI